MRVLVVNPGSSSLKLSLLDEQDHVVAREELSANSGRVVRDLVAAALRSTPSPDAVGLRVVHGGSRFTEPTLVDDHVVSELRSLLDLAPLHQRASLSALDSLFDAIPGTPVVACFDTAFHATLPFAAATYAIPLAWRKDLGIRRFGFHGFSHAYAARRARELLAPTADAGLRLVTCHLGAGASLAAIRDGVSVDTTMGFTPLEGLVMATRSGTVDPGVLLWLQERAGLPAEEVRRVLEHESGLTGLAGTSDMRAILERVEAGEPQAKQALEVYLHRLCAAIASMAAALGGIDGVVFTGGVGENAPVVRERATNQLAFLGLAVDPVHNENVTRDDDVSSGRATTRTLVVHAREDLEIVRGVRWALQ